MLREVSDLSRLGDEQLLSVSEYTGVSPRLEILERGEYLTRAESLEGYKRCQPGDLVINIMLAWKTGLGVAPCAGIVSPAYAVFRATTDEVEPKFLHYLLRSPIYVSLFRRWSYGVIESRWRLYPEVFLRLPILLPPVPVQRNIAAFLNRETARLDDLISEKERLVKLLEEKRTALISQAVTKGVDPSLPMKESGIEWLGQVPAHWTLARARTRIYQIEQGWSPQCDNRPAQPGEWGVLKVGCMNSGQYEESENKALPADVPPLRQYEIKVGDLIMSRANTTELVGMVGRVHATQGQILLCDKLYRIKLNETKLDPEYAVLLLRSPATRHQLEREATGASGSMKNISNDVLKGLVLPFPPLAEQKVIVRRLERLQNALRSTAALIHQAVARLREYRTALITAAVTGQINVAGGEMS